ncbi:GTP cyclohydrolase I [Streptomyces sp. 5K101]|uniref:GTP cyclohydrolase I n=1 Tax=Streptomyces sp. 5K101 TaxID=3390037 RepID=UPI00397651AA
MCVTWNPVPTTTSASVRVLFDRATPTDAQATATAPWSPPRPARPHPLARFNARRIPARWWGLSKFGRIAQHFAGRLQVQERFTRQDAECLASVIGREDVAVVVRGHLCMSMRGARMEAARTTTVHTGGRFGTDRVCRRVRPWSAT